MPATLAEVKAAIDPGDPGTINTAGTTFADAVEALRTLADDVAAKVSAVLGGEWTGPASEAFGEFTTKLTGPLQLPAKSSGVVIPARTIASGP